MWQDSRFFNQAKYRKFLGLSAHSGAPGRTPELFNRQTSRMVIAIDGPAGSGKSTLGKKLAKRLGFRYIDTGAMYRALTLKAITEKINPLDEMELARLARESNIVFKARKGGSFRVFIDGKDVTRDIRSLPVTNNVSQVSAWPAVRRIMVKKQRDLIGEGGVVVEGRDIATVVFPQADIKIFLTASVTERAKRRRKDLLKNGHSVSLSTLEREIIKRDKMDSSRQDSPLTKAPDAYLIDTTSKSPEKIVREILNLIKKLKVRD